MNARHDARERLSELLRAENELAELRASFAAQASLGGKARAKKLSAAQRSEIARHAANTRWRRHFRSQYENRTDATTPA